jgi:hypothetical protein
MSKPSRSVREFTAQLTSKERALLRGLTSPSHIQAYLDQTPYSTDPIYRSPLTVLRERRAHCFDGACFAALALARLGHPPRLIDMLPWDDDDHVLAIYKRGPRFGSIAKSNFTGLRGRERVTLFSAAEVRAFTKVDDLTVRSNLWAADPKGLRKPQGP